MKFFRRSRKTVFLHIGHYKTGTSAIQKYCSDHSKALAAAGFLYPVSARANRRGTNHAALSLTLAERYGFVPPPWYKGSRDADESYGAFLKEVREAAEMKVIVSSEEFIQLALRKEADAGILELKERFAEFDVKIVIFVREPFALLKSWYNELNKGPKATQPFPLYFKQINPHFLSQRPIVEKFRACFGIKNVILRPYRYSGMEHVESFLHAVGCTKSMPEWNSKVNTAQDLQTLELDRIAKAREAGRKPGVSSVGSMVELMEKVDLINSEFNRIGLDLDEPLKSELSLKGVYRHHEELLKPLVHEGQAFDPEAAVLRDSAVSVELTDAELALVLMRTAHMIRPHGPFIERKVQEYEEALSRAEQT